MMIETTLGALVSMPPLTVPPSSWRVTVIEAVPDTSALGVNASTPRALIVGCTSNSVGSDTRTLKIYEGILNPSIFYRIHKSHIIDLDFLKEYLNEDGHFAVLKNGKLLPVARNRVSTFVKTLKTL